MGEVRAVPRRGARHLRRPRGAHPARPRRRARSVPCRVLRSCFPDAVVPLVREPTAEAGARAALRASLQRLPFHAAAKMVLGLRGVPIEAAVRPPLRGLSEHERSEVERIVEEWQAERRRAAYHLALAGATASRARRRFVQRCGFRLGAARFVAGESVVARGAVSCARPERQRPAHEHDATRQGLTTEAETRRGVAAYRERVDASSWKASTNVALMLTHLCLALDGARGHRNVAELVSRGAAGNFVRIDMEESPRVEPTLRISCRLREAGHDRGRRPPDRPSAAASRPRRARCRSRRGPPLVKVAYLAPAGGRVPARRATSTPRTSDSLERSLAGGRLHRYRAARRDAHRARDRVRDGAGISPRAVPVPDALRRPAARCSSTSSAAATRCSSPSRTARTGTATSCGGSPSVARTCSSSCGTSIRG